MLEFCVLFGIVLFQQHILMSLPLVARAILMIVLQWLLLIVPVIFMRKSGTKLKDLGFSSDKIGTQILVGVLIAAGMTLIFTVLPVLAGFKDMVGSNSYTKAWQFCYEFVFMILGTALAEEFFYRGFLVQKLMDVKSSKWFAITISSAVFGVSHIFTGNIIQVITTFLLGMIFCICRDRIKHCSTLSIIIAHGMYNAQIALCVAFL